MRLRASLAKPVRCGPADARVLVSRHHRDDVEEDVIVFQRLVMQIIAARAEIEGAAEIGGKSHFLTDLPGALLAEIFADEPVGTA